FVGPDTPLGVFVDDHHRRLAAGAHAAADLQGDGAVGGGLADVDAQGLFGFFDQLGGAGDITGRPHAEFDGVPAARPGGEEGVKADDPVHHAEGDVQLLRHIRLHRLGDIADLALQLVEHDHGCPGDLSVFLQDFVDLDPLLGDNEWIV